MHNILTQQPSSRVGRLIAHVRTPIYRNGYALILSSALTSCLGLFYWFIAARRFSAEQVGYGSAAIASLTLLEAIARLELNGVLTRFLPRAGRHTVRFVVSAYCITSVTALLVGSGFVVAMHIRPSLNTYLYEHSGLLLWFTAALAIWCVFNLQDYVLLALDQAVWIPLENALFATSKIAVLLILSLTVPDVGIFLSWTLSPALLVVPVNAFLFLKVIPRYIQANEQRADAVNKGQVARYAVGEYLSALFGLASLTLPPLIVAHQLGPAANAYFYLPWIMTGALTLVTSNMTTSLVVEASRGSGILVVYARQTLFHVLKLLSPLIALAFLLAPVVLGVLGKHYAEQGSLLLRLLLLADIPTVFVLIFLGMLRVRRRMKLVVIIELLLSLGELLLGYILLSIYGIIGIGIAVLTVQGSAALVLLATGLRPVVWNRHARP